MIPLLRITYLILLTNLFSCNGIKPTFKSECEFYTDENGKRNGEQKCFYENGELKDISYWRDDTIQINEHKNFFPTGEIKEYHFYDLAGYRRFSRFYDKDGKLIEEKGDILSHDIISSYQTKLGDSVIVQIFVASPPGCTFKVFGLDSEGRYNVNNKSDINFISKHIIQPSKPGDYVFVYEIDFIDSLQDTKLTRKGEVSFQIIQ